MLSPQFDFFQLGEDWKVIPLNTALILPGAGNVPQLAPAPAPAAPLAVPAAPLEALAPELLQTPGSTVQLQEAAQLKGGLNLVIFFFPK